MQHGQLAFQKQNERSILKIVRTRHTPSPRIKILKVANSGPPPPQTFKNDATASLIFQHNFMLVLKRYLVKKINQMV